MKTRYIKTALIFIFLLINCVFSHAQIQDHFAEYDKETGISFCIDGHRVCDMGSTNIRLKTLNRFRVSGDSLAIREQLEGIKEFCVKERKVRIRIIEYYNSPEIKHLDPILKEFKNLSILIINDCDKLKLENVVRYINNINIASGLSLKKYKKAFKNRPSIFYLNTLVLRNQNLQNPGPPPIDLKRFNYLEELIIDQPKAGSDTQAFVNSLVNNWIVPDTTHYLQSIFFNLRFLSFTNCGLESIPSRLKYKYGLISLDLSGNNLKAIPECLVEYKSFETMLSLDLSDNNIKILDQAFLDSFCRSAAFGSKLSKYLFLSKNEFSYSELEKLRNKNYRRKFNTITFECNPGLEKLEDILKLAKDLDDLKIAKFMTGAQRSETDYNPYNQLIGNCD